MLQYNYMATINISITNEQARFIDELSARYNFENRSELMRSLIRLVQFQPDLISVANNFPFVSPQTKSKTEVLSKLKQTGKYSKELLTDIKSGLKDSKFFIDK